MSQHTLSDVATGIRAQAAAYCESNKIPGYLAGVYHDGDQVVVAHGVANLVTGAPVLENTGFLFGSVTKLLTTTLVLQQVERGVIDLDERVIKYLPEFRLATPSAAEKIRVRNLLNHTNGIDADLFLLEAKGRDALKLFVEGLGQYCGTLFGPDEYISYSNGGMILAGSHPSEHRRWPLPRSGDQRCAAYRHVHAAGNVGARRKHADRHNP